MFWSNRCAFPVIGRGQVDHHRMGHQVPVPPISGNSTASVALTSAAQLFRTGIASIARRRAWLVRGVVILAGAPTAYRIFSALIGPVDGVGWSLVLGFAAILSALIVASYLPGTGVRRRRPGYATVAGFYIFLAGYALAAGPASVARVAFALVVLAFGLALRVRGVSGYASEER
jgi:hypothetical protein